MLAPNLRRDRVGYDGRLKYPLRFREALAALHDVVISDLRYKPRDGRPTRRIKPSRTAANRNQAPGRVADRRRR